MLFWLFVIMSVVGLALCKIADHNYDESIFSVVLSIVGLVCVIGSLLIFAIDYSNIDGQVDRFNTRYEMLVYQYENDIYENDNDLGKRELIKEIQDWNEDLAYRKSAQDDFWLGIYYPDIYDQFNYIPLEGGN